MTQSGWGVEVVGLLEAPARLSQTFVPLRAGPSEEAMEDPEFAALACRSPLPGIRRLDGGVLRQGTFDEVILALNAVHGTETEPRSPASCAKGCARLHFAASGPLGRILGSVAAQFRSAPRLMLGRKFCGAPPILSWRLPVLM